MIINIKDQDINYTIQGSGRPILLLHGWGADSRSFAGIAQWLAEQFTVYSLDFCGFGASPEPKKVWTVYDYADMVQDFITALNIENPIILGHSFGGRISIILGSRGIGAKILLVDAAGVLPKRSAQYYIKVYSYKAAKKIFALPLLRNFREQVLGTWQKNAGSSDYQQTSGIMRGTFVKVVNEDLCPLMPQISAPTLLIYGEKDTDTPVEMAKKIESLIPGSGLAVIPDAGHFSFIDKPQYFRLIVESFLQEEMK